MIDLTASSSPSASPSPLPDTAPRSPRTLAIILDRFLDKYAQQIFAGVHDFTHKNGINLICAITPVAANVGPLPDLLGPQNVDGILFISAILTNVEKDRLSLTQVLNKYDPLPSVSIGESFEGIHSVTVDNRVGMAVAIQHLIDAHGLRKLAFVRGPVTNQDADLRFATYKEVLKRNNIAFNPDFVFQGDWSVGSGAKALQRMLLFGVKKFEAIVCANDAMATGVINELHSHGLLVPTDMAVIGFDNIGDCGFSLTTVAQPVVEIGRRSANLLWDLCRGIPAPQQITLPAEMIVRASCGCIGSRLLPAITENVDMTDHSQPLAEYRHTVALAMAHALGDVPDETAPEWLGELFDAFVLDVTGGPAGRFSKQLDAALRETMTESDSVTAWFSALAVMRGELMPRLSQPEIMVVAESLFHQAEQLIQRASKRLRLSVLARPSKTEAGKSGAQARVPGKFVAKLAALGVRRCYAVLFEDEPAHAAGVPQQARVVLAYDTRDANAESLVGTVYPARQLLPDNLRNSHFDTLLAMPLRKGDKHLGLIFFEKGDIDGLVFESLRWQLSERLWLTSQQPAAQASSVHISANGGDSRAAAPSPTTEADSAT